MEHFKYSHWSEISNILIGVGSFYKHEVNKNLLSFTKT